jgi:hypothetical protein
MTRATGIGLKAIYEIIRMLNLATLFVLNALKNIIQILFFITNDMIAPYGYHCATFAVWYLEILKS